MNQPKHDSQIKQGEVISDENTELTDAELEEVDGGFGKRDYYSYSSDRGASYTPTSSNKGRD